MKQFEIQQQDLVQKKKWNWKKISVLAGVGAFLITGTGLISWGVTKQYLNTTNNSGDINTFDLPKLTYKTMNFEQFNQMNKKFYEIKNVYIKKLATEQLMFYLSIIDFQKIKAEIIANFPQNENSPKSAFELTPNLSKMLTEKMINTVGSNLRVWGLNSDYAFDPNLVKIEFNLNNLTLKNAHNIKFDLDLGYIDSPLKFKIKGELKDSENKTSPIVDFTKENLAKVFEQANELFNNEINRNGYFIGLNFNGKKDDDKNWLGDQTVNLQEFNNQTWDYILNSLKNFNLVKEDVFVDGLALFNIDGWNPNKIYLKHKDQVKVHEIKNEIWLGKDNDFGAHSIVSKIKVSYKTDEKISFEFSGSYLQNHQWGNY